MFKQQVFLSDNQTSTILSLSQGLLCRPMLYYHILRRLVLFLVSQSMIFKNNEQKEDKNEKNVWMNKNTQTKIFKRHEVLDTNPSIEMLEFENCKST